MIVRFHFHQNMRVVFHVAIAAAFDGIKPPHAHALNDRGIVGVSNHGSLRMARVRIADHREERLRLRLAVDYPIGVEYLVAAMLGVRLREHHQLDVGRIAPDTREVARQVFDLVVRERQPHFTVGDAQRIDAAADDVDGFERLRLVVAKQLLRFCERAKHGLGHAVVNQRQQRCEFACRQAAAIRLGDKVRRAALDAFDRVEPALARDVGGFRRPRRNRAQPWHYEQQMASFRRRVTRRPVGQDTFEDRLLIGA